MSDDGMDGRVRELVEKLVAKGMERQLDLCVKVCNDMIGEATDTMDVGTLQEAIRRMMGES